MQDEPSAKKHLENKLCRAEATGSGAGPWGRSTQPAAVPNMHPHGSPVEGEWLSRCLAGGIASQRGEKRGARGDQGTQVVPRLRGNHPGFRRGGVAGAAALRVGRGPDGVGRRFIPCAVATAGAAGCVTDRAGAGHRRRSGLEKRFDSDLTAPPGRSRTVQRDQQQHQVPQAGQGAVENPARSHANESRGRPAGGRRAQNSRCHIEESYAATRNSTRSVSPRFLLCGIAPQRSLNDPRTLPNLPHPACHTQPARQAQAQVSANAILRRWNGANGMPSQRQAPTRPNADGSGANSLVRPLFPDTLLPDTLFPAALFPTAFRHATTAAPRCSRTDFLRCRARGCCRWLPESPSAQSPWAWRRRPERRRIRWTRSNSLSHSWITAPCNSCGSATTPVGQAGPSCDAAIARYFASVRSP